jgi:Sen15 protein
LALFQQLFYCDIFTFADKKVWDISHHYSPDLDLIYIQAKRERDSGSDTFVPINMNSDTNLQFLRAVQNELGTKQDDGLSKK